jgi:prolyl-tRNA editing enzyme YbaK/EbsC (Cys-tRNA(Pro) deacylase)
MTVESVRAFFKEKVPEIEVTEHTFSTASVADAAATIGVAPGQIAKTLAIKIGDNVVLVVARGDARLDNKKLKAAFGGRPSMLSIEVVADLTGHPVGGVCPFGLIQPLPIYCDVSLKDFDLVHPAAGSKNSSVCLSPARLAELTDAQWVDVCQPAQAAEAA